MLSAQECLAKAQAQLDEWAAQPSELSQGAKSSVPGYEIIEHRVTPLHVIAAYVAAPNPGTGEREALAGNIPLSVDRRTGAFVDSIPLLVEHWPERCIPGHAGMWLEAESREHTTIRPAASLAGVNTIEAIRALRKGWILSLKEAKALVETMVENGMANLDAGDLADHFRRKAARDMARALCSDLEAAGVRTEVGGFSLMMFLGYLDADQKPEASSLPAIAL